jgi:lipoyl(octanoyl) transferase
LNTVKYIDLALIDYKEARDYQEKLFNEIVSVKLNNRNLPDKEQTLTPNHLIFCEHPHVYTLGNSGDAANLLVNEQQLISAKATYYKTNRGGDITYHGPGQIVGYPILDLDNFFTDIHKYLRYLEEIIILTLAEYKITAGRSAGETGVWLDADDITKTRKICAMGIRASRWVTMHGFALNVNADMDYFNNIIPCGIADKAVTSMEKELGHKVLEAEVKEKLKKHFAEVFECEIE